MSKINKTSLPKWDLSEIYKSASDPKIEKDIKILKERAIGFEARHKGKVKKYSFARLLDLLGNYNKLYEKIYLLSSYAEFSYTIDTKSPKIVSLLQRTELALTDIQNHFIFFSLELAAHPKLPELIKDKKAGAFKFMLQNLYANKKHLLRADQEKLLNLKSITARSGWVKLFTQTDAQIKLKYKGKEYNQEEALKMLYSPSRQTRKNIAEAYSAELKKR